MLDLLLNVQSNGVTFLPSSFKSHQLIGKLLDVSNAQHGYTGNPTTLTDANLQVHIIDIAPGDLFHLGPTNRPALYNSLFLKLCKAFSVPEYYGYHFNTLKYFLKDLSWIKRAPNDGHVLIVQVPQQLNGINHINHANNGHLSLNRNVSVINFNQNMLIQYLDEMFLMLNEVAMYWRQQNVVFHTLVINDGILNVSLPKKL